MIQTPTIASLFHSADVWRSVQPQLLQDHREAGGGGAGVPHGGGAHLQPFLRAAGEVRGLLRWREARVSSHHDHKRHHAGERGAGAVEPSVKGSDRLVLQTCEDRSQSCTSAKETFTPPVVFEFGKSNGRRGEKYISCLDWFVAAIVHSRSASAPRFSCWKSGHLSRIKNMFRWLLWSTRHVNVGKKTSHNKVSKYFTAALWFPVKSVGAKTAIKGAKALSHKWFCYLFCRVKKPSVKVER